MITQVVDRELDLEHKKHQLLRAVQETQRGLTATSDQRSIIEEALVQSLCYMLLIYFVFFFFMSLDLVETFQVTVEGFNGGEAIDLVKLDGTWRLQYTSAPDVVVLFEAASRFPFFQVVNDDDQTKERDICLRFCWFYLIRWVRSSRNLSVKMDQTVESFGMLFSGVFQAC